MTTPLHNADLVALRALQHWLEQDPVHRRLIASDQSLPISTRTEYDVTLHNLTGLIEAARVTPIPCVWGHRVDTPNRFIPACAPDEIITVPERARPIQYCPYCGGEVLLPTESTAADV